MRFHYRYFLLFLSACFIVSINRLKAQANDTSLVQSPYYDAIALFYAMNDCKAYPMLMTDEEVMASNESAIAKTSSADAPVFDPGPFVDKGKAEKKYKIIESATGKVLVDNYDQKAVVVFLAQPENKLGDEKKQLIYEILARNAHTPDTSEQNLLTLYKDNSYFYSGDDNIPLSFLFDVSKSMGVGVFGNPASISKLGGSAASTRILEGVAEFLVEAVNKELNEAFFIRLKETLEKYPELSILFPNSLASLEKVEVTQYASSLNMLKTAFGDDIKAILSNISKLATLKKYQDLVNRHPALTLVFAGCDLISMLNNDFIPAEILYEVNNAPYIAECNPNNFSSTIKLAALLSNSLRDIKIGDENKNTRGWIDRSSLNTLRDNKALFQVFMGLFAQQSQGIIFSVNNDSFNLQKTLFKKVVKKKVLDGQFIVYNFAKTKDDIESAIQGLQGLRNANAATNVFINIYLQIANDIIGLSDNCLDVLPSDGVKEVRKAVKAAKNSFLPVLKQANSVLASIEAKEYAMTLYKTDTLLQFVFVKENTDSLKNVLKQKEKELKDADGSAAESLLQQIVDALKSTIKNQEKFDDIRQYYLKYGLFIAAVATAKTPDEVKEAINAVALPTGSSRIKKERLHSFSLNAYVGVYHAWNKKTSRMQLPKTELGITAPIGLAYNFGHFLGRGSFTLYGGIIDIGAIFTYKATSDSTIKSDIQLGQVLSPSLGALIGVPLIKRKYNIPLSIGANYQWGPRLRKVNEAGNSVLPLATQRFNVFIAVDIPILNFYVSKK